MITTAVYHIMSPTKQLELGRSSLQLSLFERSIAAFMLLCIIPFVENYHFYDSSSIWNQDYSILLVFSILYTVIAAVAINIWISLAIRLSSALTYNVISQLKGITILLVGIIVFHEPLSFQQIIGIAFAVVEVFDYSRLRVEMHKHVLKQ